MANGGIIVSDAASERIALQAVTTFADSVLNLPIKEFRIASISGRIDIGTAIDTLALSYRTDGACDEFGSLDIVYGGAVIRISPTGVILFAQAQSVDSITEAHRYILSLVVEIAPK